MYNGIRPNAISEDTNQDTKGERTHSLYCKSYELDKPNREGLMN